MRFLTLFLLLVAAVHAAPVAGQAIETIDLRAKLPATGPFDGHLTVGGAARRDVPPHSPAIEVSLVELDRDTYTYFESFTYRVALKNTGSVAIAVPRQRPTPAALGQPQEEVPRNLTRCLLQLRVRLAGVEHAASTIVLEAEGGDSSRAKQLAPGESVEFIAAGRWDFLPPSVATEIRQQLPATFDAVAAFVFSRSPLVQGPASNISQNSLAITLLPFRP